MSDTQSTVILDDVDFEGLLNPMELFKDERSQVDTQEDRNPTAEDVDQEDYEDADDTLTPESAQRLEDELWAEDPLQQVDFESHFKSLKMLYENTSRLDNLYNHAMETWMWMSAARKGFTNTRQPSSSSGFECPDFNHVRSPTLTQHSHPRLN